MGVGTAPISRCFGSKNSKEKLNSEVARVDVPFGLAADPHGPLAHITDQQLHDIAFGDWQ